MDFIYAIKLDVFYYDKISENEAVNSLKLKALIPTKFNFEIEKPNRMIKKRYNEINFFFKLS